MITYWKEQRKKDDHFYRVQTDETKLHQIMKRKKAFSLTGIGINCKLWIYRITIITPQKAQAVLSSIRGKGKKKKRASAK